MTPKFCDCPNCSINTDDWTDQEILDGLIAVYGGSIGECDVCDRMVYEIEDATLDDFCPRCKLSFRAGIANFRRLGGFGPY